jgi:hypothetical protein
LKIDPVGFLGISPPAQQDSGFPVFFIHYAYYLMALFLRGQGKIAARLRPTQPDLQYLPSRHLVERKTH